MAVPHAVMRRHRNVVVGRVDANLCGQFSTQTQSFPIIKDQVCFR